jgi:predicted CoA-binding protein
MHQNPTDAELKQLLTNAKTIAVVGASSNPAKASYGIMRKLLNVGYQVIPVNPRETEVLGQRAYPSLSDVPVPIDIVNVFRRSEDTPPIADEAVKAGAKALWLQSGIESDEAAARAKAGGLTVVMDACLGTMHAILRVPHKPTESPRHPILNS